MLREFPKNLTKLLKLKNIDLSKNNIGVIPDKACNYRQLKRFEINNNKLKDIPTDLSSDLQLILKQSELETKKLTNYFRTEAKNDLKSIKEDVKKFIEFDKPIFSFKENSDEIDRKIREIIGQVEMQ